MHMPCSYYTIFQYIVKNFTCDWCWQLVTHVNLLTTQKRTEQLVSFTSSPKQPAPTTLPSCLLNTCHIHFSICQNLDQLTCSPCKWINVPCTDPKTPAFPQCIPCMLQKCTERYPLHVDTQEVKVIWQKLHCCHKANCKELSWDSLCCGDSHIPQEIEEFC